MTKAEVLKQAKGHTRLTLEIAVAEGGERITYRTLYCNVWKGEDITDSIVLLDEEDTDTNEQDARFAKAADAWREKLGITTPVAFS